jgi:hypothetical protein
MDSVLGLSTKSTEDSIKFIKKVFRSQGAWTLFIIFILIFDWGNFLASQSRLSAFSFGAMVVTAFWSVLFLFQTYDELRNEKRKLKFLEELQNTQIASGERQQYLDAKKYYENLVEQLKEKKNE